MTSQEQLQIKIELTLRSVSLSIVQQWLAEQFMLFTQMKFILQNVALCFVEEPKVEQFSSKESLILVQSRLVSRNRTLHTFLLLLKQLYLTTPPGAQRFLKKAQTASRTTIIQVVKKRFFYWILTKLIFLSAKLLQVQERVTGALFRH